MRSRFAAVVLAVLTTAATSGCEPEDAIRWAFREHSKDVQDQAVRVATCESRLNPSARSRGGHLGLFQMSPRWHSHRPGMPNPFDAVSNAVAAESLYREAGWSQWSCQP